MWGTRYLLGRNMEESGRKSSEKKIYGRNVRDLVKRYDVVGIVEKEKQKSARMSDMLEHISSLNGALYKIMDAIPFPPNLELLGIKDRDGTGDFKATGLSKLHDALSVVDSFNIDAELACFIGDTIRGELVSLSSTVTGYLLSCKEYEKLLEESGNEYARREKEEKLRTDFKEILNTLGITTLHPPKRSLAITDKEKKSDFMDQGLIYFLDKRITKLQERIAKEEEMMKQVCLEEMFINREFFAMLRNPGSEENKNAFDEIVRNIDAYLTLNTERLRLMQRGAEYNKLNEKIKIHSKLHRAIETVKASEASGGEYTKEVRVPAKKGARNNVTMSTLKSGIMEPRVYGDAAEACIKHVTYESCGIGTVIPNEWINPKYLIHKYKAIIDCKEFQNVLRIKQENEYSLLVTQTLEQLIEELPVPLLNIGAGSYHGECGSDFGIYDIMSNAENRVESPDFKGIRMLLRRVSEDLGKSIAIFRRETDVIHDLEKNILEYLQKLEDAESRFGPLKKEELGKCAKEEIEKLRSDFQAIFNKFPHAYGGCFCNADRERTDIIASLNTKMRASTNFSQPSLVRNIKSVARSYVAAVKEDPEFKDLTKDMSGDDLESVYAHIESSCMEYLEEVHPNDIVSRYDRSQSIIYPYVGFDGCTNQCLSKVADGKESSCAASPSDISIQATESGRIVTQVTEEQEQGCYKAQSARGF